MTNTFNVCCERALLWNALLCPPGEMSMDDSLRLTPSGRGIPWGNILIVAGMAEAKGLHWHLRRLRRGCFGG